MKSRLPTIFSHYFKILYANEQCCPATAQDYGYEVEMIAVDETTILELKKLSIALQF